MSTPHIEHFVDERGNITFRGEIGGMVLSEEEVKALAKHVSGILDENAKLRHDLEEANNQAEEVCIENAKLRELAQDMLDSIAAEGGWVDEFEDSMRELGVEVDG